MPRHRASPSASPMTGSGGASSTPPPLNLIVSASGILHHPLARVMTNGKIEWSAKALPALMQLKHPLLIAFSDKDELKGGYADTRRENFARTMLFSCFSLTEIAKRAADLMPPSGGAMITLTYGGSMRVMPNYNVMGVAKAALEASTRYLAADFGPRGIRVNAISAGPAPGPAGLPPRGRPPRLALPHRACAARRRRDRPAASSPS